MKKRGRTRGVSLIELLFSGFVTLIIVGTLAQVGIMSGQTGKTVLSLALRQKESRRGLDRLTLAIQEGANVLSSYGTDRTDALNLILAVPSYDASNRAITGKQDTIVFQRVGMQAPYTIQYRVIPATGSARPAVADNTVIARDVTALQFQYVVADTMTGNGVDRTFALTATNTSTTLGSIDAPPVVLVNGQETTAGVTVSSAAVQFAAAPTAGQEITVLYPVDPASATDAARVSAITIGVSVAGSDPSQRANTDQSIRSTIVLRNF